MTRITTRRHVLRWGARVGVLGLMPWQIAKAAGAAYPQATAITQVFGDGLRFVAVVLDYGVPVAPASTGPGGIGPASTGKHSFAIAGRTITRVYVNDRAQPAASGGTPGRYVVIEMAVTDPGAALLGKGPGGGGGPGGPGGAMSGPPRMPEFTRKAPQASIVQTGPVRLANGRTVAASKRPVAISKVANLIVDEFRQLEWTDPASGTLVRYNLFVPRGYDPAQTYPLVLFMHDAGVTTKVTIATLLQGLGAISFASPRDQARHPSFVLAPQFDRQVANDASETTSDLDAVVALIGHLSTHYAIDKGRIYTTGQSGGAMMSLAMNIKYPDLFAASFIVAGQWAADTCASLADKKMWIMVAQGDLKAFPGENAITAVLEQHGAAITRDTWDGRWDQAEFAAHVAKVAAAGTAINYTVLAKGTVVPPGQSDDGGSNHVNTWRIAYTIPGIRDWLMQHRK